MARISVSGVLRHIDTLPTIEEAIECQKWAQQHVDAGDFDTWVDEIRSPLKQGKRKRGSFQWKGWTLKSWGD